MTEQTRDRATRRNRPFLLLGLALLALGVFLRGFDPEPVEDLRLGYFDLLQKAAPRPFAELPVRVVDIDEASLAEIGQWPWPRTEIARLLDRLDALGAAVVAFDVLFAEPDRYSPAHLARDPALADAFVGAERLAAFDNDRVLADAMQGRAVVLGVAARSEPGGVEPKAGVVEIGDAPAEGLLDLPGTTPLAPPLGETAAGIGGINVAPGGRAGIVRQVPLLWQSPGGVLPGLGPEALRLALGDSTYLLEGVPGVRGAAQAVGIGEFTVPTDSAGRLWVRYRHDDPRLYVSAADVLRGEADPGLQTALEGQIVLVGTSAAGLLDIRTTALGEQVPGVSIHAQIIEQILLGEALRRSDFVQGLEILAFLVLGALVTLVMSRSGAGMSLLAGGLSAIVVLGASWVAFSQGGWLFDATFPLLGGAVNFSLLVGYQFLVLDRDKRRIRRSFAQYVSPEVLGQIETDGHRLELGGVTREITVMFTDIRDFTPLSEALSAHDLVSVLNDLFSAQGAEILRSQGTIDKFIGDAIMAFWNAPLEVPDHPLQAANAALAMRQSLADFNARLALQGRPPIRMAIGCATGPACVGNIGSRQRFNYTVIGDAVNLAARTEAACRRVDYDILVSESIAQAIDDRLALMPAGRIALKGKSERQELHIVVGDGAVAESDAFAELLGRHRMLLAALRHGKDHQVELLGRCLSLAPQVEPGLPDFYAALMSRPEDFRGDLD